MNSNTTHNILQKDFDIHSTYDNKENIIKGCDLYIIEINVHTILFPPSFIIWEHRGSIVMLYHFS
jgi:hypothetical protein